MDEPIQGYEGMVAFTSDGNLIKSFVKPVDIGSYSCSLVPDVTPLAERTSMSTNLVPDPEGLQRELTGHAFLGDYFPVSRILATSDTACTIKYEAFLPHTRLDYLVREVISNYRTQGDTYDISNDSSGVALIEVNRDLGKRLRKMHEDTYDPLEHKVNGTVDFRDGNVLVGDVALASEELSYRVIDFTSFGKIDVYHSMSTIPLTEMVTAAALYEDERKLDSEFAPEHLEVIMPALRAFLEGYMGESPGAQIPLWLTAEQVSDYNRKRTGIDWKLYSIPNTQMPNPSVDKVKTLLDSLTDLLEEKGVLL